MLAMLTQQADEPDRQNFLRGRWQARDRCYENTALCAHIFEEANTPGSHCCSPCLRGQLKVKHALRRARIELACYIMPHRAAYTQCTLAFLRGETSQRRYLCISFLAAHSGREESGEGLHDILFIEPSARQVGLLPV